MASKFDKYQKRRLISSYFSVVLSIGLVLFLVGLLGLLVLNSKKVTDHFKEQIALTIFLKDSAKEVEITQLSKNFISFLGTNPLQNSIDVHLNANFVDTDKIDTFVSDITSKSFVDEVAYDKPLISLLNDNIKKISVWVLAICGVFTLIAVLLINNSIRLTIYAKRFTIKTMQMVGATKSFIRKPFILLNVKLGTIGGILAMAGMGVVLFYLDKTFPNLELLKDQIVLIGLFIGVFVLGLLITLISTFFAAQRFLGLQTDELYY